MTVLYIIDTLQTGGAETSLLEISSRLKKFNPVICVLFKKESILKSRFAELGIRIIELDIKKKFWWIDGVIKFKHLLTAIKPDIVHATLFKSEIVTRLSLLGKKIPHVGSFVNDSYSANRYDHQTTVRNLKLNVVRVIDAVTAQWVPHFMSITQAIAKTNSEALHINPEKITCIYRGRTVGQYDVHHPSLSDRPFTYLVVARLLKRKGYLELFEAAKKLQNRGRVFLIKIAGDGNDLEFFKDKVSSLGIQSSVEFLLNRSDVPDLLKAAHCFVFPSHYEGQGGALVEAMFAAKPIVASDISVFREQITHDETGRLFKLFDVEDLADTMQWMMDNYSEGVTMGLRARSIAEARFDIEKTVMFHEQLYTRLLKS